jgi:metal-responsive CopG/Arc/MetJ family transcriptional regulator
VLRLRFRSAGIRERRGCRMTSPTKLGYLCHTRGVPKNLTRRAHVVLPVDVVAEIDKLVGKRGRSAFITEVARDEIQRRQQRNALRAAKAAWKDEDHPELKDGAAVWVSQMRAESEKRFQEIEQHRDRS